MTPAREPQGEGKPQINAKAMTDALVSLHDSAQAALDVAVEFLPESPEALCEYLDAVDRSVDALDRAQGCETHGELVGRYCKLEDQLTEIATLLGADEGEGVVERVRQLVQQQWQPIETAPDATLVLVYRRHGAVKPAVAIRNVNEWRTIEGLIVTPTHWMPLPQPPTEAPSGAS